MRAPRRVDENQSAIVDFLRSKGLSVLILSELGGGCPDILVGAGVTNVLLEIKNPTQPPNKRALTDDERKFHDEWLGPRAIVETEDEAFMAVRRFVSRATEPE